ncbi:hypothetical protein HDU98_003599 [Podochytrium sp. JEL0797]|nr:hypothetical protein HDU98_003599 [Podochytrium sp. JEL0797]
MGSKRKHDHDSDSSIEQLMQWATGHGAYISNLRIATQDGLRGVVACTAIPAGGAIGQLPPVLILSESTGLASAMGIQLDAYMEAHADETVAATGTTDLYAKAALQFAAFLASEAKKGGSFWSPYFDTLPSDFGLPLQWPPADVARFLHGTNLEFMAKERHRMLEAAVALISHADPNTKVDFESLAWAYSAILSRAFPKGKSIVVNGGFSGSNPEDAPAVSQNERGSGINDPKALYELCLYPVLDMINHQRNQKIEWNSESTPGITFIAPDEIAAGQVIWNNYGSKGNENLLSNYGFVLNPNPEDYAKISLNISSSDPLHHYRKSVLDLGVARHISTVHLFFGDDKSISDELMTATRILVGTEREVESILETLVGVVSKGSAKLDLVALSTLFSLIASKIAKIEEGKRDLAGFECTSDVQEERLRMANIYREGQLKVFKNALRLCQEDFSRILSNHSQESKGTFVLTLRNSKQSGLVLQAIAELTEMDEQGLLDQDTILSLILMHEESLGSESEFDAFFKTSARSSEEAIVMMGEQSENMTQFYDVELFPFLSQSDFFAHQRDTFSGARFVWANSFLETHGVTLGCSLLAAMGVCDLFEDDVDAQESIFGVVMM